MSAERGRAPALRVGYWADLNPDFGARGERRWAVFYGREDGTRRRLSSFKTRQQAEDIANRYAMTDTPKG